jgi:hypothetical protein
LPRHGASTPDRPAPWRGALRALPVAVLLLGLAARPAAASPGSDPTFASLLSELGLVEEAVGELERQLLAGGKPAPIGELAARLGLTLAAADQPAAAARALTLAADQDPEGERGDRLRLTLGVIQLRAGRAPEALQLLARLEAFGATPALRARAHHLGCVAHLQVRDAGEGSACVPALLAGDPARLAAARPLLARL